MSEKSTLKQFDPLSDLPVAQFALPADLAPVNMRTLSPFQRALLVIDGTVTKFIEAYTMEPVEVVRLAQEPSRLAEEDVWLEAPAQTPVLSRQVLLEGRYSHVLYAYALSLVVVERLPEAVRRRVEADNEGLGRIINQSELETRREILWYGREHSAAMPPAVQRRIDGEFVSRTYRIIWNGKPLMLIQEKFPAHSSKLPSHH